jgi:hypothetical protein
MLCTKRPGRQQQFHRLHRKSHHPTSFASPFTPRVLPHLSLTLERVEVSMSSGTTTSSSPFSSGSE